jgi:hypothetical protein
MLLKQAWILLERGSEEAFAGQEHYDEVWRGFELLPVGLRLQCGHVISDIAAEVRKALRPHGFVGCLCGIEERLDRSLRIDHNCSAAWQPDHKIRAQNPILVAVTGQLGDKVAVGEHPG